VRSFQVYDRESNNIHRIQTCALEKILPHYCSVIIDISVAAITGYYHDNLKIVLIIEP